MKATVTKIYHFDDDQIKTFMTKYLSYDEGEYTEDDIYTELESATGDDLDVYGTNNSFFDTEVEIEL